MKKAGKNAEANYPGQLIHDGSIHLCVRFVAETKSGKTENIMAKIASKRFQKQAVNPVRSKSQKQNNAEK